MPKNLVRRMFMFLAGCAILGPLAAHLVSPSVAAQYDNALLGLLAALLYKGPVYALGITAVVVLVARYLLGIKNLAFFQAELAGLNNDSYAIILGFTALIVTIVMIVVLGG